MGKYADLCRETFSEQLALIRKPELRDFVIEIFDFAGNDDFFVRPASKSRRYHPLINEIGDGGLVRHTKWAVWCGDRFSRSLDGTGRGDDHPLGADMGNHYDHVIAALIPHDLMKSGDPLRKNEPQRKGKNGGLWITGCHGVDLAEAVWRRMLKGTINRDQLLILSGIAGHMGVWTKPENFQPRAIKDPEVRLVAEIVHIADYTAAQKFDDCWNKLYPNIWAELQVKYATPPQSPASAAPPPFGTPKPSLPDKSGDPVVAAPS